MTDDDTAQVALFDAAPTPRTRNVLPADWPADVVALGNRLQARWGGRLHLGTSSWYFPGWAGIVWRRDYPKALLPAHGLPAYAQHPLLRAVSLDRALYRPLSEATYAGLAAQVPAGFRFVVKAPALVTDAMVRDAASGAALQPNPLFLDPAAAVDACVRPAVAGLGNKLGVLVFQLSPLPARWLDEPPALLQRLNALWQAVVPALPARCAAALEVRDPCLLTPALAALLKAHGVRYCLGLHDRMPAVQDQLPLLRALWPADLACRWNLQRGLRYAQARDQWSPFDRLQAPDVATRKTLAQVMRATLDAGHQVFVTINNKAEGSAPLSVLALAQELLADAAPPQRPMHDMADEPIFSADDAFRDLPSLIAEHARQAPQAIALRVGVDHLDYASFDVLIDRVAASLQRDGYGPGDAIAICASSSVSYLAVFIGALRAGLAVAPLAPGATAVQLADMASDADARLVFIDGGVLDQAVAWPARTLLLEPVTDQLPLGAWLMPPDSQPKPVTIEPAWPFNLIYSSGTTGTPKGIVQPHAMRWAHIRRAAMSGYARDSVTLIATPLYSNTTLVSVIPALAAGGSVVLMPKFDALAYLQLAQRYRATHTMLVPVQYQRLMARPDFSSFDLSSFRFKFSTSAPFHAALKADVLARWPGALTEYYGMTEGGGTLILQAHLHPHKLHTVGQPSEGHEIRLIDEQGAEISRTPGGASQGSGEVVGRSPGMMSGYHKQPAKTAEAEWFDSQGQRYIRTGDVGRFDDDGFLILHDRRKDMVISGGFNIYPSDLEAVLRQHPAVADAAVVGVPSAEWGETPVAFVVLQPLPGDTAAASPATADSLRQWVNAQVGKMQRLSAVQLLDELPRSAIGKVLKRELRDGWNAMQPSA